MTTPPPIKISDEAHEAASRAGEDAYRRWRDTPNRDAYVAGFIALAAKTAAEAVAPLIAVQVLQGAYWKLREHAFALRGTEVYRRASERKEGTLGESPAYQRYRWLEATARGIEEGARDLAELLGVAENEIDEPENGREHSLNELIAGFKAGTVSLAELNAAGLYHAPDDLGVSGGTQK